MQRETKFKRGSLVAWVGLIVAIVALVFALLAYNQTKVDLSLERSTAAENLASVRARYASNPTTAVQADISVVREELAEAYAAAGGEAEVEWQRLSAQFDQLEAALAVGGAEALADLERLIADLRASIEEAE